MKNIYKVLVLLLIALNSLNVNAQQYIVRGRIIDKVTILPLLVQILLNMTKITGS